MSLKKDEMTPEARELKREYYRKYYAEHKEQHKEKMARYWNKKATQRTDNTKSDD